MSDISLHSIRVSKDPQNDPLKELQSSIISVTSELSEIQRAINSNHVLGAMERFKVIKPKMNELNRMSIKLIPYSDNDDLESQDTLTFKKQKLKISINQIADIYNQIEKQLSDLNQQSYYQPQLETPGTNNEEDEIDPNTSHGKIGGLQYTINHTPVNAAALELQQQEALQREQEIERISESVKDINLIFHDLDSMVLNQGSLLSQIEDNIYNTVDHLASADDHLTKAERWQRRTSFCQRLLGIITIVVVMIVVLVIIV